MIDTHTHIFDEAFDNDRALVVQRALDSGVERMVLPAIDSASHEALISSVREYPNLCFGAMGLHPTSVNDNDNWGGELDLVRRYLVDKPIRWVAIGEIGLDLYWSRDYLKEQMEAFTAQMELSIEYNLPVIIHTRDAWDEMIAAVAPYASNGRGVFHSFSGGAEHLDKVLAMENFYVGIGGVVTYNKSALRDMVADIPLDRILLETDSPYLPPAPYRGKRNESGYMGIIAQHISVIKSVDIELLKRVTHESALKLFWR